jgi:hypothetical protein
LLLYSSHLPLGVPNGLVIQLHATNSFLAQSTTNQPSSHYLNNRFWWRALETWLYHEELRDLHQLYFFKSSQLDSLVSIIYPMFLLAITCTQLIYIESYSPLCMCWVLYLACVCICYAFYLFYFEYSSMCMLGCTPCTVVLVEPIAYCLYLVGPCKRLMDHPILRK